MIITIDGSAASGKSTVARLLAETLDIYYINSGLLYRALAYIIVVIEKNPVSFLTQASIVSLALETGCFSRRRKALSMHIIKRMVLVFFIIDKI